MDGGMDPVRCFSLRHTKNIKKVRVAKTFLDSSAIFHEGAGIGNMSELTGALLASAQLLPFLSN